MDNKYRYGKYGLLWQDIYELFQKITDRCFDEGPDMINKLVEEFFEEHKQDPLFQEAFHRWCDTEEDYEEITESKCINCSQSGELYKNRLKDMVREGQLEGADAGEFMLDLIDSISDEKAKELCVDYGIPVSEDNVESSTRIAASADSWPDEDYWHELDDFDFEDAWSTYLCDLEDAVYDKYNIFAEPSVQGSIGSMYLFDDNGVNEDIEIRWKTWQNNEIRLASSSSSAEEFQQKFDKYIARLIRKNGWAI